MTFKTPGSYSAGEGMSAAKLNRDFFDNMLWLSTQYPRAATLWHDESTVVAGNAITYAIDTSQEWVTVFYQDPAAVDDQFTQTVRLNSGLYQVKFLGQKHSGGGQFSIDIDGQSVGDGYDTYSAALQRNVDLLAESGGYFEALASKVYTVTVTVYGQHASSSDYALYLTAMEFVPKSGVL